MDEQFETLTTYWAIGHKTIAGLITRCGFDVPDVDPAIPGFAVPAVIRVLRHLADPKLPAEARNATRDAISKWLTAGDLIQVFDDDPQPWRFTAVLDLLHEVEEFTKAAHKALDRRRDLN